MKRLKEVIKDYLDLRFEGVDAWYLDTEELSEDIVSIILDEMEAETSDGEYSSKGVF